MAGDLFWLVCTALLSLLLPTIYLIGRVQTPGGQTWAFGNRAGPLAVPEWTARAIRAHDNLTENLAPFAIFVLAAHAAGKSNDMTVLGAEIFFFARIAHFLVYTAGIIYLRTFVFFIGTVGEIMILLQLFR